ncbi:MAG: hypothetical protein ACYCZW_03655 [Minisyncoccota bacterium]
MQKKIYKIIPLILLGLFVFIFVLAPSLAFADQPITFIKSPFGWGLIVVMYILAFLVGFILKFIMRKFWKKPALSTHQKSWYGGVLGFAIGVGLLLWAITTTWSPILIFFSGLAIYIAIFGQRTSGSEEVLRSTTNFS